jgi:hypothetical protein
MKDSHQVLVVAVVFFVIGIALIVGSMSIHIPSAYSTFFGIPYAVNPEFASSFYEMLALFVAGFMFLGFGLGVLGTIGYILRLEKRLSQIPPPP